MKFKRTFTNMGKAIAELRREKGISQADFIKRYGLGVTHQFLGNVERGQVNLPVKLQARIIPDADLQSSAVCDFIDNYNKEIKNVGI